MSKAGKKINLIIVAVFVILMAFAGGCSSTGQTSREVHQMHMRDIRVGMWQMQQDIDDLLMIDRPDRTGSMDIR